MRNNIGWLGSYVAGVGIALMPFSCASPRVSVNRLKNMIAATHIDDYCGGHSVEYMGEINCFICYKISDSEQLAFMRTALSYFNTHYKDFLSNAIEKSKESMKKGDPYYNFGITLDGLVRAVEEIPEGNDEMEHVMKLYSASTIGEKK